MTTWWMIAGADGYLGDPGGALMDSRFSEPLFDWCSDPTEAWHYATIERACLTINQLKGTERFAGVEMFVVPFDR